MMKHKTILAFTSILLVTIFIGGYASFSKAQPREDTERSEKLYICGTVDGKYVMLTSEDDGLTWVDENGQMSSGPESAELWEIDEFVDWMEQQREEYLGLVDKGTASFYVESPDGEGSFRSWTKEDVDALYSIWQQQLELMREGYRFTKTKVYTDGGGLMGEFDPGILEGESPSEKP